MGKQASRTRTRVVGMHVPVMSPILPMLGKSVRMEQTPRRCSHWTARDHVNAHPDGFIRGSRARIPRREHEIVLVGGHCDESVVGRTTRDAEASEVPMRTHSRVRQQREVPHEVLVDQHDGICGTHARVPGQASQHRVGLGKSMPAESEGPPGRPAPDRIMRLMRCDEQRHSHTRVDCVA